MDYFLYCGGYNIWCAWVGLIARVRKFVYFIISTLVSFSLCYIVMLLETYLLYIVIGLGVLLAVVIVLAIVLYIRHRKV